MFTVMIRRNLVKLEQKVVRAIPGSLRIRNQKLQTILPFEGINTLVTDTCAPADSVRALRDKGVHVVLALMPGPESRK